MKKKKKENKNEKNLILERYIYPIDFAETWFNLLQERIIDNNLLEKFIKEFGDYTLIGESVRDKKREHVLVYKSDKFACFYPAQKLKMKPEKKKY